MDFLFLSLRVAAALTVVLGLIYLLIKVRNRLPQSRQASLRIISKVQLSKRSSIVVVDTGGRGLLLGVTDHAITHLGDVEIEDPGTPVQREALDIDDLMSTPPTAIPRTTSRIPGVVPHPSAAPLQPTGAPAEASYGEWNEEQLRQADGTLHGSVLSPQTWRQAVTVLRDRTART